MVRDRSLADERVVVLIIGRGTDATCSTLSVPGGRGHRSRVSHVAEFPEGAAEASDPRPTLPRLRLLFCLDCRWC
jgi:hypothetical protein